MLGSLVDEIELTINEARGDSFYVVLWVKEHVDPDKVFRQISNRYLEGLEGISDDSNIIHKFGGNVDKATLKMDKDSVIKKNKVEKVEYSDVNYLLKDNLRPLSRILNRKPEGALKRVIWETKHYTKQLNNEVADAWGMALFDVVGSDAAFKKVFKQFKRKGINNLDELIDIFYSSVLSSTDSLNVSKDKLTNASKRDLKKWVRNAIFLRASQFSGEEEWRILDEGLSVPKNSVLYFHHRLEDKSAYRLWKRFVQMGYNDRLNNKAFMLPEEILDNPPEGFTKEEVEQIDTNLLGLKNMHQLKLLIDKYNLDKEYRIRWLNLEKMSKAR